MRRLPRLTLIAFAGPALPLAAMYFPVYVFLAEFYSTTHGLSLAFIGSAFIAVRLFDAVSDPVMGLVSDRVRLPVGRRRPWLVIGCPLVMLSAWQLFVPGADASAWGFGLWLFLLTLGWTIMLTPYFAWGAEVSGDYAERGRVAVWREAAGLIGTILAAVLYGTAANATDGLHVVALLIVTALPLTVAFCLWQVPEPTDFSKTSGSASSLLSVLVSERRFLRLLIAYFINGAANALPASLFLFFVGARLEAPDWGPALLILYFGAAVLAAPLWPWLIGRYSKNRVWCCAMIYAAAVFSVALTLGPGDVAIFAAVCIASGAALGADLSLPAAIQADLVDIDTLSSGQQRTGAFFALWSLATKAALAVASGVAFIVLEAVFGFEAGAQNTALALAGLAGLYALAPIVLKLIAVVLMWSFPLSKAEQEATRARIEAQD